MGTQPNFNVPPVAPPTCTNDPVANNTPVLERLATGKVLANKPSTNGTNGSVLSDIATGIQPHGKHE